MSRVWSTGAGGDLTSASSVTLPTLAVVLDVPTMSVNNVGAGVVASQSGSAILARFTRDDDESSPAALVGDREDASVALRRLGELDTIAVIVSAVSRACVLPRRSAPRKKENLLMNGVDHSRIYAASQQAVAHSSTTALVSLLTQLTSVNSTDSGYSELLRAKLASVWTELAFASLTPGQVPSLLIICNAVAAAPTDWAGINVERVCVCVRSLARGVVELCCM
jgi:hypothetical protein